MHILLVLCFAFIACNAQNIPTNWFTQKLDHFNTQDNRTFQQRYYVYDGYWNGTGPVFMYLGAETVTEATSLVNYTSLQGWAIELGALLVSAEHRYYGESLPFTNPTVEDLGYLVVDQALEDYVQIVLSVQRQYNATNCPIFCFGGSYGGLVSAASRIRYPNVYWGAYATGAPVNISYSLYFNATTYSYFYEDKLAAAIIHEGFQTMLDMIQTQAGRDELQSLFKICIPLDTIEDGWNFLFWAQWGFVAPSEFNYPFPGLYGIPYPLEYVCQMLTNETHNSSIAAVAEVVAYAWNFTGVYTNPPCFPTINIYELAGPTGVGLFEFLYQMCTQVYVPSASNGVTDFFYQTNQTFILDNFFEFCDSKYGVTPDLSYWKDNFFGDGSFRFTSNIVFTNGIYDPTRGLSILNSLSDSIVLLEAVMAHTQDILIAFPGEDPSVAVLRNNVVALLANWTAQYPSSN